MIFGKNDAGKWQFLGIDGGDVITAATTILVALGIMRRNEAGKVEVTPEAVNQLVPGYRGRGFKDEAANLRAWSRLNSVEQLNWVALMTGLGTDPQADADRAMVILVLATIPDVNDQVLVLRGLANLDPDDFRDAVDSFRLNSVPSAVIQQLGRLGTWVQKRWVANWPGLRRTIRTTYRAVERKARPLQKELWKQNRKLAVDLGRPVTFWATWGLTTWQAWLKLGGFALVIVVMYLIASNT